MKIRILLAIAILCLTIQATATDYKPIDLADTYQHNRWGTEPKERIKTFRAFMSSFDGPDDDTGDAVPDTLGVPNWVSYELRRYVGDLPSFGRPGTWITESDWHTDRLAPNDDSYLHSGYSRGHLCMKSHASRLGANADWNTHTVFNAVPQIQSHNNGPWHRLEDKTSDWADGYGVVWIVAGPIYDEVDDDEWIGDPGEIPVAIPDAMFKIVIKASNDADLPDVLAFIFPHMDKPEDDDWPDLETYLVSVDDIEARAGLDFLTVLTDPVEAFVESKRPTALWPGASLSSPTTSPSPVAPISPSISGKTNINTAALETLETLPGVGPALAQKITNSRPYTSIDDLLKVSGIGNVKLEKLGERVTVE
jgi:endonuclease G